MIEQRKSTRMHVFSYICVSESDSDKSIGRLKDITTDGMRLCGDEPLEPFTNYRFNMILPNAVLGNRSIDFDAHVIWCRRDKMFNMYDAGIQLMNISQKDRRIIEDFMQNTTFEERWLSGQRLVPREN